MNRGDRREPIFREEADCRRFLETLGEACATLASSTNNYTATAEDSYDRTAQDSMTGFD